MFLSLKFSDLQLYHSETLELMLQRWSKLERDFRMKNGRYDISKIPDIYDCVKYDVIHNATLGLEDTLELFRLSRALADIVIPQVRERRRAERIGALPLNYLKETLFYVLFLKIIVFCCWFFNNNQRYIWVT